MLLVMKSDFETRVVNKRQKSDAQGTHMQMQDNATQKLTKSQAYATRTQTRNKQENNQTFPTKDLRKSL